MPKRYPPEQTARARALMERLVKRKYGTQDALAEAMGVEQGTVSALMSGNRGLGEKTADGLKKVDPKGWAAVVSGTGGATTLETPDRYEEQAEVVAFLQRTHGATLAQALEAVDVVFQEGYSGRNPEHLRLLAEARLREIKRPDKSVPTRKIGRDEGI